MTTKKKQPKKQKSAVATFTLKHHCHSHFPKCSFCDALAVSEYIDNDGNEVAMCKNCKDEHGLN